MDGASAGLPPTPIQDGKFLHFLKELPAWCIILIFVSGFLVLWTTSHDDFIPRIIDGLIGALLTAIVAQRPRAGSANINADSIETSSLNTDTIDQPTINVNKEDASSLIKE